MEWIYDITAWVIPVVLAITVHEVAHGYVAWRFGDPTARDAGRLTLNPIAHVDPVGTVALPGLLLLAGLPPFGFAKPVPVDYRYLPNPKKDMVWVAAAGPFVNVLMAVGWILLANVVPFLPEAGAVWLSKTIDIGIIINLVLALFNMIPLPPLDGGRVAVGLLPMRAARKLAGLERFGLPIIFAVILVPYLIGEVTGVQFSIIGTVLWPLIEFLYNGLIHLFCWTCIGTGA